MGSFSSKVVLVTGAGSGIGRATAELFAREGASVVLADRTQQHGAEVLERLQKAGSPAHLIIGDVSKPKDCEALVDAALAKFGRLDAAVNNAGIAGELCPTGAYDLDAWRQVIDVNLNGVFYCMRYEIPAMLKNGGGAIVNMSSILGQVAFAGAPAYVAAKHGVVGLTQAAGLEYATQGIRINAIGPGFIETPMIASVTETKAAKEGVVALHPIGRLGKSEEVAELALWLCSPKASFVTASYYPVDGGYLAR